MYLIVSLPPIPIPCSLHLTALVSSEQFNIPEYQNTLRFRATGETAIVITPELKEKAKAMTVVVSQTSLPVGFFLAAEFSKFEVLVTLSRG